MPLAQITNPLEAFNSAGQDNTTAIGSYHVYCVAATAIAEGQIVTITYNTSTAIFTATIGIVANTGQAGGVCVAACLAGAICDVVIHGFANVQGGATVAAGAPFSAAAAGRSAAASATIGSNFGIAITAHAAGGALYMSYIGKM